MFKIASKPKVGILTEPGECLCKVFSIGHSGNDFPPLTLASDIRQSTSNKRHGDNTIGLCNRCDLYQSQQNSAYDDKQTAVFIDIIWGQENGL